MATARKNKQLELSSIPWARTQSRPKKARIPWAELASPKAQASPANKALQLERKRKGDEAETLALAHLLNQGLLLIERNHRCRCGEIDLLMQQGSTAVVVEVRHRSNATHGSAADSVTRHKQNRITRCAQLWWVRTGQRKHRHLRFDVVTLENDQSPQWIQNAWQINSESRPSY